MVGLVWGLNSWASPAALRTAIIAPNGFQDYEVLLSAALAESGQFDLVERTELVRVIGERELGELNAESEKRAATLVGADMLVVIDPVRVDGRGWIRIVATATGAVLGTALLPEKPAVGWGNDTAKWVAERCKPGRALGIPLVIMVLKSPLGNTAEERSMSARLALEMSQFPDITLLERWRLGDSGLEKQLLSDESAFLASALVVEGTTYVEAGGGKMELLLRPSTGGEAIFRRAFESPTPDGLVRSGAAALAEAVKLPRAAPQGIGQTKDSEVASHVARGEWALRWGSASDASEAFETALALDSPDKARVMALKANADARGAKFKIVINDDRRANSEFPEGIRILNESVALAGAACEAGGTDPSVYSQCLDVLSLAADGLTYGASLKSTSPQIALTLTKLRQHSRRLFAALIRAEIENPKLTDPAIPKPSLQGGSYEWDFHTASCMGTLNAGLWHESPAQAIEAIRDAFRRFLALDVSTREDFLCRGRANGGFRGFGWIARWPGGFNTSEDLSAWAEAAKADGPFAVLFARASAVNATTPFPNTLFARKDEKALVDAADALGQAVRELAPKMLADPFGEILMRDVASVLEEAGRQAAESRWLNAQGALGRAWSVSVETIYDSPTQLSLMTYNRFHRPDMIPAADLQRLTDVLRKRLGELKGGARSAVESHLIELEATLSKSSQPVASVPPLKPTSAGTKTAFTPPTDPGLLQPAMWFFVKRAEESGGKPSLPHHVLFGEGQFLCFWRFLDGFVLERFIPSASESSRWPMTEAVEAYFGGAAVFDGQAFVRLGDQIFWTPIHLQQWDKMPLPNKCAGFLGVVDGRLFLILPSEGSVVEIDYKAKRTDVITSARVESLVNPMKPAPVGLKFLRHPVEGSRTAHLDGGKTAMAAHQTFVAMAKQGELSTYCDPIMAAWVAAAVRKSPVNPATYKEWPAKEVIPGLAPLVMSNVTAAAADEEAIWLFLPGREAGGRLARIPLDGSAPSEWNIAAPEHVNVMLVTPEHVCLYNYSSLPMAAFSKEQLTGYGNR